jgi:hypothetical protein
MTFLGSARLSKQDIAQIIAEHMAVKYGVDPSTVKVEMFAPKGKYGTEAFANVDITGYANTVRSKT